MGNRKEPTDGEIRRALVRWAKACGALGHGELNKLTYPKWPQINKRVRAMCRAEEALLALGSRLLGSGEK